MKSPLIQKVLIDWKNFVRRTGYYCYAYYQRSFSKKISIYDFQTIDVIRKLPINAVCIDVGINEGQILHAMVNHCKDGKIYGFEPIPILFKSLSNKYSSERVLLHQVALSDKEEYCSFYYYPLRSAVSGLSKREDVLGQDQAKNIKLLTKCLDKSFHLQRLDLIKIDVEGAELRVLKGSKEHIERCRPIVVFECGKGGIDFFNDRPDEVYDFFHELGYSLSLLKYYLEGHAPLDRHTFLIMFNNGYEYQFIAYST